ncbi:TIGR01777 family protein [candidate division GN15 bacterium]|nr:TIGR01777 family protein [candidate division GN15 bacterium]
MKVLISGSSGLIGSALQPSLHVDGHTAHRLVREKTDDPETVYWKPSEKEIERDKLEGYDAVIHLAGENIAGGRWTDARKQAIRESRIQGTSFLAETLAGLEQKPKVLVCASAMGYYGNRGDEKLTEDAPAGKGFLAEVCQAWEAAAQPAREAGIRTVHMRTGVVLSTEGGALEKMLTPFKTGLAGKLGSGEQYMSWVSRDDVVRGFAFAMTTDTLSGPVNMVAPEPVTNEEFTRTLGKVLDKPTAVSVPAFALKMMVGEMADEMLLASMRVIPKKLQEAGFEFSHPELESTLRTILGDQG